MDFALEQLTRRLKALADPTRFRIVHLLDGRSLCVYDLQQVLGYSQPFISRHLAILRAAELVRTERQGVKVCYSLSRAPLLNYPLGKFLSEVVPFFPELQADVRRWEELDGLGTLKTEEVSTRADEEDPVGGPGNEAGEDERPAE